MMFSTASGVLSLVLVGCVVFPVTAQPAIVSEFDLKTVIDRLGDFDYGVQAEASGLVRRVPEDQARTALAVAVTDHEDERFFITAWDAFWAAPKHPPVRGMTEELIRALEF